MANKYVIPNPSVVTRERAKREYYNALRRFAKHVIKSQENVIAEFFRAIHDFFSTLNSPKISNRYLIAPESPPDSNKYNETLQAIYDDMQIAYTEQNAIEDGILSQFNYSQTERLRLERLLKETKAKLDTYVIISKSRESSEIWIKDSFQTTEKIDVNAITSADMAHINTDGGYVTLPRAGMDAPWSTQDDIQSVRVETKNLPGSSSESNPIENRIEVSDERLLSAIKNRLRRNIRWEDHYQGKMYGIVNQNGEDGIRSDSGAQGTSPIASLNRVLIPNDNTTVDTFWEYELVILEGEEGQWTELVPVESVINQSQLSSRRILTEELRSGFITRNPNLEYSPGKTTDAYVWSQQSRPNANTGYTLEVDVFIVLKQPKFINSLSITPHTFGKKVYPSLADVATSSEEDGTFVSLPHFSQQNKARLQSESVTTLRKNYISMISNQHFTFPTRWVRAIRISFVQDTPYQIGYTMALASRNWRVRYTLPNRSSDTVEYTEYIWVDILGKEFLNSLSSIVRTQTRTGTIGETEFDRRFEELTNIDVTPAGSTTTAGGTDNSLRGRNTHQL